MAKILKNILVIILIHLFSMGKVLAQADSIVEYTASKLNIFELSLNLVYPVSTFEDKMNTSAVGLDFGFLRQTQIDKPTFWGTNIYWHRYLTVGDIFADFVDNQLVDINRRTSVDLAGLDMLLRFYPELPIPVLEFYLEGNLGTKIIFTTTRLNIDDTGENIDFYFEESDVTLSYGVSAGFQINLHDYVYYLNFKTTYSSGTSGTFLALRDDQGGGSRPIDELEEKNAPLEFLRYQLGVSFAF